MLRHRAYPRILGAVMVSVALLALAAPPAEAAAPTITNYFPDHGPVGTATTILGFGFTGATSVTFFNGASATTFTVTDDQHINTIVPFGATTGPVTVTTPGGSSSGSPTFTVAAEVIGSGLIEAEPAGSSGYLAWVQNSGGRPKHFDAYAEPLGGSKVKVNSRRTSGALGGLDGSMLVYQQYRRRASDIKLFNLATKTRSTPAGVNTRRWEYWPSISGSKILFGRFYRSTGKRKVILFDTSTSTGRVIAKSKKSKTLLQPGQVSGDYAVYGRYTPKTCNVYRYTISTRVTVKIPNSGKCQYAPSVNSAGTVYFGRSNTIACGNGVQLMKFPLGGPVTSIKSIPSGDDFSDTYAVSNPNTTTSVLYDRGPCSTGNQDIFEFND